MFRCIEYLSTSCHEPFVDRTDCLEMRGAEPRAVWKPEAVLFSAAQMSFVNHIRKSDQAVEMAMLTMYDPWTSDLTCS